MQSVVCTLFEGHYHNGVAALVNSLYCNGFRGSIFAGYRGTLPSWCSNAKENTDFAWKGSTILEVTNGIQIYFLPLDTEYHLTNYKPNFMLSLLEGPASNTESIYYLDPDIVVTVSWSTFDDWVKCGVALCEDLNSPLPKHHPRRVEWRNYFGKNNIVLNFKDSIYANGGFIGIRKEHFDFLNTWCSIQELMAPVIGGLHRSALTGPDLPIEAKGPFSAFGKTDQDALNATVEAWNGPISFVCKEGMGFKSGSSIIPHAVGNTKPWQSKFFVEILFGNTPREVDKRYWKSVAHPIKLYSAGYIFWKKTAVNFASFVGRFYARSSNY